MGSSLSSVLANNYMNPFETRLLEVSLWITGLPIGSSLSSVLANIYMNPFETTVLEGMPVDLSPIFKADHRATYWFKPLASIN